LLLFVFFHGEYVVEQPFKNDCVAVDTDVNLVVVTYFFKTPVEVLHVLNKETPAKSKVSLFLLAVVDNMNHDAVFEIGSLKKLKPWLTGQR
jgi:hypothetical protein